MAGREVLTAPLQQQQLWRRLSDDDDGVSLWRLRRRQTGDRQDWKMALRLYIYIYIVFYWPVSSDLVFEQKDLQAPFRTELISVSSSSEERMEKNVYVLLSIWLINALFFSSLLFLVPSSIFPFQLFWDSCCFERSSSAGICPFPSILSLYWLEQLWLSVCSSELLYWERKVI